MTDSTQPKRHRQPSDPIRTIVAAFERLNPDQLYSLGAAMATSAPRSALIVAEGMDGSGKKS